MPGSRNFTTAGSIDVVAHEWGHALGGCLVSLNSDRGYASLMNEFFGDAVAVLVAEKTGLGGNIWIMGDPEDPRGGLRNLENPKAMGQPDTWMGQEWRSFDTVECKFVGSCPYHHNATVVGKMFNLLSVGGTQNGVTVPGIGLDDAFRVIFKLFQIYLGGSPTFPGARAELSPPPKSYWEMAPRSRPTKRGSPLGSRGRAA